MKIKVKIENQEFEVSIADIHARPVIAEVDGERIEVMPADQAPASAQSIPLSQGMTTPAAMPAPATQAAGSLTVNAPLPGVIVSIEVKAGDQVKPGQTLLTLEAMKMKNAIRATREAVIAEVHVANTDQVQHGQLLVTYQA